MAKRPKHLFSVGDRVGVIRHTLDDRTPIGTGTGYVSKLHVEVIHSGDGEVGFDNYYSIDYDYWSQEGVEPPEYVFEGGPLRVATMHKINDPELNERFESIVSARLEEILSISHSAPDIDKVTVLTSLKGLVGYLKARY